MTIGIAAECSNVLLLRCYTRRAVYTCTAHTLVRVHTYSCKLVTDAGRDARFSFTFVSNRLRFSDSCRTRVTLAQECRVRVQDAEARERERTLLRPRGRVPLTNMKQTNEHGPVRRPCDPSRVHAYTTLERSGSPLTRITLRDGHSPSRWARQAVRRTRTRRPSAGSGHSMYGAHTIVHAEACPVPPAGDTAGWRPVYPLGTEPLTGLTRHMRPSGAP